MLDVPSHRRATKIATNTLPNSHILEVTAVAPSKGESCAYPGRHRLFPAYQSQPRSRSAVMGQRPVDPLVGQRLYPLRLDQPRLDRLRHAYCARPVFAAFLDRIRAAVAAGPVRLPDSPSDWDRDSTGMAKVEHVERFVGRHVVCHRRSCGSPPASEMPPDRPAPQESARPRNGDQPLAALGVHVCHAFCRGMDHTESLLHRRIGGRGNRVRQQWDRDRDICHAGCCQPARLGSHYKVRLKLIYG